MSERSAFPGVAFFDRLARLVCEDAEMRAIGRYFEICFAVVCGTRTTLVEIGTDLTLRATEEPGIGSTWSFTLRGSETDWEQFLRPVPPAPFADVLGMNRHSETFTLEGDRRAYVRHLRPLHRLFELARRVESGYADRKNTVPEKPWTAGFEPIVGRYLRLESGEEKLRIYVEEAGTGRPLVCLHTAGADSRQYRHLLLDGEITTNWRVVAFDLPGHGRSFPPEGWEQGEYLLTTEVYARTVMEVIRALELEDSVVLGCSMGGTLALELARAHSDEVSGVVALEAAAKIEGRFLDWSVIPDAGGSTVAASWTYGLMAPESPSDARHEVWWTYAQGGPGVYRGDTYFYAIDWDLRGRETEINTERCPVYMMTGEYDHACTPEESRRAADAIPGARFTEMKGLGHFPMAENYPRFREYLVPVLGEISNSL